MTTPLDEPIRVGISACLLGERVRYDGGHKHDRFLTDILGGFVEFVPVCPEVEVGMGIPRETIRLELHDDETRLVAPKSGTDHTRAMTRYARRRVRELEEQELCGYVLKRGSPSCGMERVRLYGPNGMPTKKGRGLFAAALLERYPLLPVEEEGRLCDARLRDNFFVRLFAYRRLRDLFRGRWSVGGLVRFHTAEKLLLMAHDPQRYRSLGRLVAGAKGQPRAALREEYGREFMSALARQATPAKNVNVLQHIQGYFKKHIDADERAELTQLIQDYRAGLVPLIVPVTLLRHHVRRHGVSYLEGQTYLEPHPKELMLRNHV